MVRGDHPDLPDLWVSRVRQVLKVRKARSDSREVLSLVLPALPRHREPLALSDSRDQAEVQARSDHKDRPVHKDHEVRRDSQDRRVLLENQAHKDKMRVAAVSQAVARQSVLTCQS